MVVTIVLVLLLLLGFALWSARGEGDWSSPSGPDPPSHPPSRFRGRVVEPDIHSDPRPRSGQQSRLRNGSMVSAINNGRTVTGPDTIGLACLAPISKCTLGEDCLCVAEEDRGRRVG